MFDYQPGLDAIRAYAQDQIYLADLLAILGGYKKTVIEEDHYDALLEELLVTASRLGGNLKYSLLELADLAALKEIGLLFATWTPDLRVRLDGSATPSISITCEQATVCSDRINFERGCLNFYVDTYVEISLAVYTARELPVEFLDSLVPLATARATASTSAANAYDVTTRLPLHEGTDFTLYYDEAEQYAGEVLFLIGK